MRSKIFILFSSICLLHCPQTYCQDSSPNEIQYFQEFLAKFHPTDAHRVLVLHVVRCSESGNCDFIFALTPLFDKHLLPYINSQYMFEVNTDLVIVRTELDRDEMKELNFNSPIIEYSLEDSRLQRLCDYTNENSYCLENSFSYCYSWELESGIQKNFIVRSIDDLPMGLSFYNNSDIERVEGKKY